MPLDDRAAVFDWARDAFISQIAISVHPFGDLPDDCAGDVMEFVETALTRTETLQIAKNCSSTEACFWVCRIIAAGIAADVAVIRNFHLP